MFSEAFWVVRKPTGLGCARASSSAHLAPGEAVGFQHQSMDSTLSGLGWAEDQMAWS